MSNGMPTRSCTICSTEKPCTIVPFIPKGDYQAAPAPYAGAAGIPAPNQFFLNCCEDCGLDKGTIPKKAWIVTLIGYAMIIGGIAVMAGGSSAAAAGALLMGVGWIMSLISSIVLIVKLRYECSNGVISALVIAQVFPVIGMIALLPNAKKINRCARAVSALKEEAAAYLQREKDKDEEMDRLAAKGDALTEEQKKMVEEHRKEKETQEKIAEEAREEQVAQANRANYRGAIFGIIFTIILAIIGISTYSSGHGYMTFFGIKLSSGGFAALIGAFLVYDIYAIVSAKKKM